MCLIVFAWQTHAEAPLILAANRDEFHARPTAPAGFWSDAPHILAGRDLQAGGTWLGITRSGRFAAITNVRDPGAFSRRPGLRSRGDLTRDFLTGSDCPLGYVQALEPHLGDYEGFNLLVGDRETLCYLSAGRMSKCSPRILPAGIYGLSNAALDVPWPKVRRAKIALRNALGERPGLPTHARLRDCLANRSPASAGALAGDGLSEIRSAGAGGAMARQLSAQFIVTEDYGTRCTTTLRWHRDGRMDFAEQRFDSSGDPTGSDAFELEAPART